MRMQRRREISLDEKLRYLREIENIHRLSKKVLPPAGTTWARIADKHLQRALGMPIAEPRTQFDVKPGMHMHQHDPRTARVVERTLRNGVIHPHALHSYRNDGTLPGRRLSKPPELTALPYDHDVVHYVQHGSSDLVYPHGHMQGVGFVPRDHQVVSHVPLEDSVRPASDVVPSKGGSAAAGEAYH